MYINITDPCISYVNYVNQKEQKKNNYFIVNEIRQTGGGGAHVLKV